MKQTKDFYKERAIAILTSFQLLELALKIYIGKSYELIHFLVQDRVHFGFSIQDIEKYSLERLLKIFDKLNGNESLKKRLNKLITERNYIAHEALLLTIGTNLNMDALNKKAADFFSLEDELSECLSLLTGEGKKLLQRF